MTTEIKAPSDLEIKNSIKVLSLLSKIDGISYEQQPDHPDIFVVHEAETEQKVVVDVEEDTIVTFCEITDYPGELPEGLAEKLLELNHGAVHGAFTTSNNKLYFKSNLQIENLDLNELEASLRSVILVVYRSLPIISEYFSGQKDGQ